ncbi:RNA polymerase III polypeptide E [Xenopus tropicalis]|uniref:Novel protein similar to polr3e n=1 Tax=Xenopus tropicalis TaxID=8364 RepID=Q28E53_XENTR|nr:RNA polymerase III polypeptide E [Xenopus tropicalis]CAJ83703.1 novel protein similar to polr3e [Xenopus tropicalis]|eukprot:NP_001016970.1 RNA polymerase III polypeptide E [Xenopus tropicalis]
MENEDDDPIIQEIDVFLAKSLSEKLYLFQYPIRPASMTYDDVTHLSTRIKPKQQKMEMEIAINTVSPNYCRSKGEQIALNVDGTSNDDTSTYSTKLMDKQIFSSIQAASNTTRYAAALYRKGEIHLTPLHGILQMRPSFTYLDKADTKFKEREAANEGGDSSQDEVEDDIKQVTVRFSRPESEKAKQRRAQSYEFLQKKQAEETWVHLHYSGVKDSRSEHERQYLLCQNTSVADNMELTKSPRDYLSMLMPPDVEEEKEKPVAPSNVLSMAQLRTLPLGDQIKILMKNVKVMPFANLMGLMAAGTESINVLRCIQQVAMLVQGNWVVKSDVVYPKESSSPHSGVSADVLCRGRDFVMWRFTKSRWVVRKEIAAVTKLCQEDVKEFLDHMSIPRINKGWEFMLPYDEDFVKKHPDVVERQNMLWKGIESKLKKVFSISNEDLVSRKQDTSSAPSVVIPGDQLVNIAKAKATENQAQLERTLQKKKEQSKQTSSTVTVLADVHIKEEPVSDEEPMDTSACDSLSNGMVNGIHMDESSRESVNGHTPRGDGDLVTKELKEFVATTFNKQYVLTLRELKRLFNLHLASLPPGHILFSGISDKMLQETVLNTGCKQIKVPSTATPEEQKVFALWECGDSHDQLRQELLDLFLTGHRLRRNLIQTKLSQKFGDALNKQQVDKVLKDCCVCYGGMWYLKGTVQS